MPNLKLVYFELPGKAETTRLLFHMGEIPFEDATFGFSEWPALKSRMPYGQVPVLEVDGKVLAQSSAIERYAAKLAGLTSSDPWAAAKEDEIIAFQQEIMDLFIPSYTMQDAEAKAKARADVCAGPMQPKLQKLSELLDAAGGEYFTGANPMYPDILIFKNLSGLIGGSMDGVPTTLLDNFPKLKAFHDRVARLSQIAKFYEKFTEGPRLAYKPLSS